MKRERFEKLLPHLRNAAAKGCRVDILWGHYKSDGGLVASLNEAEAIERRIEEVGLTGRVTIHRFSTRSHAKFLVADDGSTGTVATIGSCNWLYSTFESWEASVRLRDPLLVSDALYELAELARPADGQIPDLTARLAELARELSTKPPVSGGATVKVVTGEEHDNAVLTARDEAKSEITVVSHRLGVTAKPAIVIPAAAAVKERGLRVDLIYCVPSGPVQHMDAARTAWEFREQGVSIAAVQRPRVHAKMLLWDSDNVVITSLNWLSADASDNSPRQEIGVSISAPRLADYVREELSRAREYG